MSHDSETPRPEGETVRDPKSKMLTGAGESESESESGCERALLLCLEKLEI